MSRTSMPFLRRQGKEESISEVTDAFESAGMVTGELETATGGDDDMKAVNEETLKVFTVHL